MIEFELSGTGGVSGRVEVTEEVLQEENRSRLHCRLYLKSVRWYGVTYWLRGTALGREFSPDYDSVYLGSLSTYEAVGEPWTLEAEHAPDGSGSVTLSVSLRGYTAGGGQNSGWQLEGSRTVPLTHIPRASGIRVTDGNIGETVQISILRKRDSYTHKLQYYFGTLSGEIDPKGEIDLAFSIPEEFYYEMTHAPEALCRMVCTTYEGDRQVGTATETVFTVRAVRCGPLLEARVEDVCEDTLELTEDPGTLIRFASTAVCTAEAQGQKGAEILSLTVNGVPLPATFPLVETGVFTFRATDSRGFVTEKTVQLPLVPYIPPTVNGWCSRPDGDGNAVLTLRGSCYRGMLGDGENSMTLLVETGGPKNIILGPDYEGDSYSVECTLEGLSYKTAHTIKVRAMDDLGKAETVITVERGKPVFDWGQGDFAFHVPVSAPRVNGIKNPALKAWPVGAVLFTADGVSPAVHVGGKWEQFDVSGLPVYGWKRLQGADTLGNAVLGQLILGTEE